MTWHTASSDSVQQPDEAESIFRERCTGVSWEISTTANYALCTLTPADRNRRDAVALCDIAAGWPKLGRTSFSAS